jgi:hypothetical protein
MAAVGEFSLSLRWRIIGAMDAKIRMNIEYKNRKNYA